MSLGVHRGCGDCRVCCIVPKITEVTKSAGKVCRHLCATGCSIHDSKPTTCRDFLCAWRVMPELDESWRPDRIGLLGIFGLTDTGKRAVQFIPFRNVLGRPSIGKELRRLALVFEVWIGLSGEWPPSCRLRLNDLPNRSAWRKIGALQTT
jgi:hypothetical protein